MSLILRQLLTEGGFCRVAKGILFRRQNRSLLAVPDFAMLAGYRQFAHRRIGNGNRKDGIP